MTCGLLLLLLCCKQYWPYCTISVNWQLAGLENYWPLHSLLHNHKSKMPICIKYLKCITPFTMRHSDICHHFIDKSTLSTHIPKQTSRSLEGPQPYEQVSKSAYYSHEALMGKWSWSCMSTDQDGFKELDLEWISPVVAEFRCPQESRSSYHAYGHAHYAPKGKWP